MPSPRYAAGLSPCDFFPSLGAPNAQIVGASEDLYRRAFELFRQREEKEWSLTDCLSFIAMQERGITESLTSDEHFTQAGFKALLRE